MRILLLLLILGSNARITDLSVKCIGISDHYTYWYGKTLVRVNVPVVYYRISLTAKDFEKWEYAKIRFLDKDDKVVRIVSVPLREENVKYEGRMFYSEWKRIKGWRAD